MDTDSDNNTDYGRKSYDVVIAGGSISGLFCANEIAKRGHSVLVVEEDYEIGSPEHCGGLVSIPAMRDLGIMLDRKTLDNQIRSADIVSPRGNRISLDAKKQNVVVIDRRSFDKKIAFVAQKNGAEIITKTGFKKLENGKAVVSSHSQSMGTTSEIGYKVFVDARGVSALIQKDRQGILNSAQYEVAADWVDKERVEVYLDQVLYPGFFAWVIPEKNGVAKIGVAGKGINAAELVESFLEKIHLQKTKSLASGSGGIACKCYDDKTNSTSASDPYHDVPTNGKNHYSIIRKVYAPIWVKGPIDSFVDTASKKIIVGDAAGQTKPTTAGGIYSCGMGGIFAGEAVSNYVESQQESKLFMYESSWREKFGKEFKNMVLARQLLGRLDNKSIERLFGSVNSETISQISASGDFDYHTSSLIRLLGFKGSLNSIRAVLENEVKRLLT